MKKAVVLLSGGLDSTTTLYFAKSKGYKVHALIFDYRQRHKKEVEAALKIAKLNQIDYDVVKIKLAWSKSSLTDKKAKVPYQRNLKDKNIPSTYVPGRNIIFLSYGFSLAESITASKVFIGAHINDYSGYPDCRPEFLKAFQESANRGLSGKKITISAPLLSKDKVQIVRLGLKLGVPFELTWSCYKGDKNPCLKCDSCRFRIEGFRQVGILDPLLKKQEEK